MASSLQVAGLASNFDWKAFTDQIMALERTPAARLEAEKANNTTKVTLLNTLGTKVTALKDAAVALKSTDLFGERTAVSTTANSGWSATAAVSTATGAYKIAVSQLATSARLSGADNIGAALNPSSDDVSGLTLANLPTGQAVTAGTFTVNGQQVTIALTDSLQDVFDEISTATGGDVTASYDHTLDRVTLTSAGGNVMLGAANDTSNFLRALKLGNNGTNTVTSSTALGTVKTTATLASANLSTAITAVDGSGNGTFAVNGVNIAYNVNTDSLSAVLQRINASTAGVSATFDAANDRIVLTNKSTGDLGISVSEAAGGLLGALGLTSGTTFTRGDNAEFTLNGGSTLSSTSNTLDSSSHGIAGLTVTATSEETQTITVAANTATMRTKIESFLTKFNETQEYLDSVTKITTDSKGKVSSAALATNREIQAWGQSLRSIAFSAISGLSGSVNQLDDLGIDFKAGSNQLEVKDSAKLTAVLGSSTTDISEFFTTSSTGFAAKFDTFLSNISTENTAQQTRLNATNASLDTQIETIDRHLVQRRALLESAFIEMEKAQSLIKQQQAALDNAFGQKKAT